MTGRGRARARGRARSVQQAPPGQPPPAAARPAAPRPAAPSEPPPLQPEPQLVGRGRQRGPPAVERPPAEVLQLSAGFQEVSIGERGGRRRDFLDIGVNTRETIEHVKASKTGASGSQIQLVTNHIKLLSRPQWILYQYHVDFNPPMESRRIRSSLLNQLSETIGKIQAFDGTVLFLPKRFNKVLELISETQDKVKVRVTITLTNELPPSSPTCFQFYNIIFRRLLRMMEMKQIGRNNYSPKDGTLINEHKINIWPGFSTSILQYETSIMLSIDISHKVMREQTALQFMDSYGLGRTPDFQDVIFKELVGLIVLTKFNNRTYRVDEIAWNMTPLSTFRKSDGTEISFAKYYKAVSLTDKMRNDFRVMRDLAVYTRLAPEQRERQLSRFLKRIHTEANVQKELRDWGLNFDTKLLNFSGRVAPPEKILQRDRSADYNPQFADWSRELRGQVLISAQNLNNWLLIYPRRNYDAANSLIQNLSKITQQMGMRMNKAITIEIEDSLGGYLQALKHNVSDRTEMVVCILSSISKTKYDAIKKYLCVDHPVPSQCVVARTLGKPQTVMSVCTKIALQMNCKLGGELWSVEIPMDKLMIIGIDIYHDTLAGKKSIAGFVASMNKEMTRWFSRCVVQEQKQEIVDGLKVCMQAALHAWFKANKSLPLRILIYRDGVGDGQLKTLVNYEVPQFVDCIRSAHKDYDPKLTVVVVKKRINARFFAVQGGRLQNPPPGTIVDTEVTRPEWYDFFIVSQSVRQGTVSPTHYNVVFDTGNLKPDHMQRLTYKLCHQYFNWPGVIRVPAPCQYAHKLAFLVGQSIHREPHTNLAGRLYYL
uniref:Piwi-like protein 1 n=1 Tax=Pyxicephalus adspersus TaxID=30357 RepID=A0AAV3AZG0_PYXAD|nr:TPA: hypothetical protein GDO54_000221 [Pyxicephalus adspersus]